MYTTGEQGIAFCTIAFDFAFYILSYIIDSLFS